MAWEVGCAIIFSVLLVRVSAIDIYHDWVVAADTSINPISFRQPVITINGMFPGPLINSTTNDFVHKLISELANCFHQTSPTNGIQQRLNSWQDGVSGTNCPIKPGTNWTYVIQPKDQIGTFTYFPSINYHKVAGGFGAIRVNNRIVINVVRSWVENQVMNFGNVPDVVLMNGKGPYGHPLSKTYESFNVTKGKTYRFRISNVGTTVSFNFRIQNHKMVLVETEGSYTSQITLDSIDVHVGQSYSVLVTASQDEADYYMVATPKLLNFTDNSTLVAKGVLHYANSITPVTGPIPGGPDPFDIGFSVNQAKSVRWNMTAGAARPNPQGTFNVTNVTLSQTFVLHGSISRINTMPRYVVNKVSYLTPDTPLKLADAIVNGTGVYKLDEFPVKSINDVPTYGVSVVTGTHKGWLEVVFQNDLDAMDSWHLGGFGFYVVGFGNGEWTPESRYTYNILDPVVRSTVQVYPGGWTAVYAFLDNPGMWNLRSQHLKHWYLGQELYIRVHDDDPNPAKERPPPRNVLLCGIFSNSPPPVSPPAPAPEAA
ncbi:hypothetical protein RJ639_004042, partial [Escallonia herrerae]